MIASKLVRRPHTTNRISELSSKQLVVAEHCNQTIGERSPVGGNVPVKVPKQEFLHNFLLFATLLLGYTVKQCHIRWYKFRVRCGKRSLVMAPRDHGKSIMLTIAYVIWRIVKNPNIRILIASNSASMAEMFLAAIKSHLEKNQVLIHMFGQFRGDQWNNSAITVCQRTAVGLKEPTISTVGVGGALVSGHFDLIIGEDLVDFENSRTQAQRDKLWNWFWTVVFPTCETSEIDSSRDGEIHLLGTRYHYDDFYGRAIGEVDRYKPGAFAHCYIRDKAIQDDGTALWPERKSLKRLIEIKGDVGSIIFSLQYQNDASLTKGRIFQPSYFQKTYKTLPDGLVIVQGTDLTVGKNQESDYFAEAIIGVSKEKDIYLIDIWRQRLTAPKQYDAIEASHKLHKWIKGGVESVAYQEALAQWLRAKTNVPVKSIKRVKDKVMRAYKIQPTFENGKFYMPEGRHFPDFIDEMTLFPDGDNDDMFDALETAITVAYGGDDFSFFFADDDVADNNIPIPEGAINSKLIIAG